MESGAETDGSGDAASTSDSAVDAPSTDAGVWTSEDAGAAAHDAGSVGDAGLDGEGAPEGSDDAGSTPAGEVWATLGSEYFQTVDLPVGGIFLTGRFNAQSAGEAGTPDYDAIAYVFPDGSGSTSVDVYTSDGTSFSYQRRATDIVAWESDTQWLAGDFDGDGHSDLLQFYPTNGGIGIDVLLWTPSGFTLSAPWSINATTWAGSSASIMAGHFLGNCTTDLVLAYWSSDEPYSNILVCGSTGSSFDCSLAVDDGGLWPYSDPTWPTYTQENGVLTYTSGPTAEWTVGDFNGDGRDDMVAAWENDPSGQAYVDLYLSAATDASAGASTTFDYSQVARGPNWDSWAGIGWYLPGDIDGDGRSDLVYAYSDVGGTLTLKADLYRSQTPGLATPPFLSHLISAQTRPFLNDAQYLSGYFAHARGVDGGPGFVTDVAIAHPVNGRVAIDLIPNKETPAAVCVVPQCGQHVGVPSGPTCP